jgi:ABC-type multidrug transport system fused ATPase/permease subunit
MLTEQFLLELFKLAFLKKQILEVLREHVKYQYLPDEIPALKKILKAITSVYGNTNNLPTFGAVSQFYPSDIDVQDYIQKIKAANIPDTEQTLKHLEEYIKLSRFQLMFERSRDLYNTDKQKEAIEFTSKESEEIVNFSITQNTSYFLKVFGDFHDIQKQKQEARDRGDFDRDKVPFGITPLDEETYGGIDKGETVYILGRSGSGKSTWLKDMGMYACRLGYEVLHIQLEGSRDEAIDKYNQNWVICQLSMEILILANKK